MASYFIGDIHGCYNNLRTILDNVGFNPEIDILYLTGDLVSRGPNSLDVLRWIRSLTKNAKMVLGNHDLHLLKSYFERINGKKCKNSFESILNAPDSDELIYWLRHQSILHIDEDLKLLMSHAGIHPKWTVYQSKYYAQEIENILISDYPWILFDNLTIQQNRLLNNTDISINQLKQIKNNINSFTKMRYVYLNGCLDLTYKDFPKNTSKDIYPWFNLSKHIVPTYNIIFGHWSLLKDSKIPYGFYGLDSGCCWGEYLTILRWEDKKIVRTPCSPPN